MDLLHIVVLALVQGLTEFLPVSSSAHLILVPVLTGWADQGLAFDVAVHVGTLLAVLAYFRREVGRMLLAGLGSLAGRGMTPDARLGWQVVLATLPVVLAGFIFKDWIEANLRGPIVIAWATMVFGLLLGWADRRGRRQCDEYQLGWSAALIIGLSQVLALIPGTSRSGITITAGLALGLSRHGAARFSFLLAIPTILGSAVLLLQELLASTAPVDWLALGLGTTLSFISALLCIHFFLRLLEYIGMLPFVVYRIVLGIGLLLIF
ncbi:MAG: undecaprenyl-diphosphate phosphatase [Gammaproteobacteria bacterium]